MTRKSSQNKKNDTKDTNTNINKLNELIANLGFDEEGEVRPERITQTLQNNYMPYAMSVIVSRAIPEIDGLKPSHRKLLYTMYKMGLLNAKRTKSANIVGQTMKLNPHGDTPIYETMVRLTRGNGALLHPYVDSKGNFGKQYSSEMAYAASRYTEARLDKFASELLNGIEEDMVDFVPNYDGTMLEPVLLPTSFPAILVNSNQGIAVGMASNICSFNLAEVCDSTIEYIKNPNVDIIDYLPAPDFSGGAYIVYDKKQMKQIYESGLGSFTIRAQYKIDKKNHLIEIDEIPYTSSIEVIMNELSTLVKEGKLKEINDVRDETDLGGLSITIDYKKNIDPEQLIQKLFTTTSLESKFSCNFNILVNGEAKVLGIKGILSAWIEFRINSIKRKLRFEDKKLADKLHLLLGLKKILLDIDKAIKIIRDTEKEADVIINLMKAFDIDEIQANYVAEIKLRHLNREYILKRSSDIESIKDRRSEIEKTLSADKYIKNIIISDLKRVKQNYSQVRRTKLIDAQKIDTLDKEDLIDDYKLKVFLTEEGYFKKIALTSLRSAGELKLKENDRIIQEIALDNKQEILIFTSENSLYKYRLYEFNDDKPSDWGTYLPSILNLEKDCKIVAIIPAQEYKGEVIFAYENGRVSRVDLKQYETIQRRRKLVAVYNDKSPLVGMDYISEDDEQIDYVLITNQNRALVFEHNLVEKKSTRSNSGNKIINFNKKYKVTKFNRVSQFKFENESRYRARKVPASGVTLKEPNIAGAQLSLYELV